MGAGNWQSEHAAFLRSADAVLLPDNDDAGFAHIHSVGASLATIAVRVRVLILSDLPVKGDVVDWIKRGGTREQLDALVAEALEWTASTTGKKKSMESRKRGARPTSKS
jgi:putative DNA primase/helicase